MISRECLVGVAGLAQPPRGEPHIADLVEADTEVALPVALPGSSSASLWAISRECW